MGKMKKIIRIVIFLLVISLLVIILKGMNWVPVALQKDVMKKYASIDEMKSQLKFTKIYLPAYFPGDFIWPPSTVLAQDVPYPAIVLEFKMKDRDSVGLIITQSSSSQFRYGRRAEVSSDPKEMTYSLEGRNTIITYGTCNGGAICSSIKWNEKDQWLTIFGLTPKEELIRIAESMLPH